LGVKPLGIMTDYKKRYIRTIRLNSFYPICHTDIGLRAISQCGFPPFIDASCRREPDFENDYPSITSICRQDKFAPHLIENDIVVYITVKGKWMQNFDHYRLVAILEVIDKRDTHLDAASWYRHRDIEIPSNCMIADNPPYQFHETAGNYNTGKEIKRFLSRDPVKQQTIGNARIKQWDKEYLFKTQKWGNFVMTKRIFVELSDPPILTEEILDGIFERVPNTQMPNYIEKEQFKKLAAYANINFIY
jgi:hypothetical protein